MGGTNAVIAGVCRVLVYLATTAGIVLSGLVALAAFMRYSIGQPFAFTEEIVGLLFSAMVFLALPYCSLHDRHIKVTIVSDALPVPWRRVSAIAATILTLIFCVVYGLFSYDFAALSLRLRSASDMGGIPLWPWMAAIPLACVLMAVASLVRWVRRPERGASTSDRRPI
jgi:TRAP-type C4-dicarboxylate transport system permease small subunit